MSLNRLRAFVEVYRQRSFTTAARNLGLTQPAISQQIASLEETIGRPLFERHGRGVVPTGTADELASDIGDRLDQAEAALAQARARSAHLAGSIQIVGHPDFLSEVVAPQLGTILESGIRVRLHVGTRSEIERMLIHGEADLGVSGFPVTDRRLRGEHLRDETTRAVAAPALVARLRAGLAAGTDLATFLAGLPLLSYGLDYPLIDTWLRHNGLNPELTPPAMVGLDVRSLRGLLIDGHGWTVLPEYLCRDHLAAGELEEIPGTAPDQNHLSYHLLWAPAALRQPRVAHVRHALIWRLLRR
ncbi:LysR family transcriptional regulator [Novosphingobium pokkalii]|uniref:LysR family transcriptional regulator n=1 Tax=Novosphingobium pokkalii TaxID=1770194 RepID=A0ABV7UX98_9SPHN|nr:LysR family transcriptional regulator [Novosphingobium pokkalii]GHC95622.1 LysR family transcriptional regulator [Novosphingobium pokkalii]